MTARPENLPAVPDVPSAVAGWRAWRVVDDRREGPWLGSLFAAGTLWPARGQMAARCLVAEHRAPAPECSCGIYAVADLAAATPLCPDHAVLGCVALWGTVVEGERGWRAGYAYPLVLFAQPAVDERTRHRLAERYGVPVHPLPGELGWLMAAHGPRLGALARRVRDRASAAGAPAELGGGELNVAVEEFLDEAARVAPRPRLGARDRSAWPWLVAALLIGLLLAAVAVGPPRGGHPASPAAPPASTTPAVPSNPVPNSAPRFRPAAARRTLAVDVPRLAQLAVSRDGRLVAAEYGDGRVDLLTVGGPDFRVVPIAGPSYALGFDNLAFTPDGRTLVSGVGAPDVRLYDTATGALRATVPTGWVDYLAMSPNGRTLAVNGAGDDSRIYLWDIETGTRTGSFGARFLSSPMVFNSDGSRLASGGWNAAARVWDVATGRQVAELTPPPPAPSAPSDNQLVYGLAFSPDGNTLITAQPDALRLWDLTGHRLAATLEVASDHLAFGYDLAVSPDGRILASATSDGIQLWDLNTHQRIGTALPGALSTGMAFLPGGDTLLTTAADGTLDAWTLTAS